MKVHRRAQATIIATLIMVAASALLTTIMLFWGIALQGASNTNFGGAVFRSNSQASEQISIDNVLFTKVSSSTSPINVYTVTVYGRNFGSNPIKLAGVHIQLLQSGVSPISFDCEVSTSATSVAHPVIVARASSAIALFGAPSSSIPGCVPSLSGTSSSGISGDSPTLTDSSKTGAGAWKANGLTGLCVLITSGAGAGEFGTIASNTPTQLSVTPNGGTWTTASTGLTYTIGLPCGSTASTKWNGLTISIAIATDQGTSFHQNFSVPP